MKNALEMTDQEILDWAKESVKNKGGAMTVDQLVDMKKKEIAKRIKKSGSKFEKRAVQKELESNVIITASSSEEMYRKAAMNQRGSSMRD